MSTWWPKQFGTDWLSCSKEQIELQLFLYVNIPHFATIINKMLFIEITTILQYLPEMEGNLKKKKGYFTQQSNLWCKQQVKANIKWPPKKGDCLLK